MITSNEKINDKATDLHDRESMSVSALEYGALFDIRGLQELAHSMVMTASKNASGGYTLTGKSKAFDELAYDLSDEISHELSPRKQLRHLAKVYNRLRPDDFF